MLFNKLYIKIIQYFYLGLVFIYAFNSLGTLLKNKPLLFLELQSASRNPFEFSLSYSNLLEYLQLLPILWGLLAIPFAIWYIYLSHNFTIDKIINIIEKESINNRICLFSAFLHYKFSKVKSDKADEIFKKIGFIELDDNEKDEIKNKEEEKEKLIDKKKQLKEAMKEIDSELEKLNITNSNDEILNETFEIKNY